MRRLLLCFIIFLVGCDSATISSFGTSSTTTSTDPSKSNVTTVVTVQIKSVYDGDTYTAVNGEKLRLRDINTPELKHSASRTSGECVNYALGIEARDFVRGLILGRFVTIKRFGLDRYRRTVVFITIPDGRDLGTVLKTNGLAVDWPSQAGQCPSGVGG